MGFILLMGYFSSTVKGVLPVARRRCYTSYWLLVDCLVFTHFILPSLTFSNVAAGPALDELLVVALRARSHALPSRAGGCDVTGH